MRLRSTYVVRHVIAVSKCTFVERVCDLISIVQSTAIVIKSTRETQYSAGCTVLCYYYYCYYNSILDTRVIRICGVVPAERNSR